jgi:hypothetical protein
MPACETPSVIRSLVHAPLPLVGDDGAIRGHVRAFGLTRSARWLPSSPVQPKRRLGGKPFPWTPVAFHRPGGARDAEPKEPREPAESRRHGPLA